MNPLSTQQPRWSLKDVSLVWLFLVEPFKSLTWPGPSHSLLPSLPEKPASSFTVFWPSWLYKVLERTMFRAFAHAPCSAQKVCLPTHHPAPSFRPHVDGHILREAFLDPPDCQALLRASPLTRGPDLLCAVHTSGSRHKLAAHSRDRMPVRGYEAWKGEETYTSQEKKT